MAGIDATRTSTGQAVQLVVDEEGWLVARTPDGEVLQRQRATSRRVKLSGDTLKLSRVDYSVDDPGDAARFVGSLGLPESGWRRIAIRVVVVGLVFALGFVGGLYVRDRQVDESCDAAREVVDGSVGRLEELEQSAESQDASFFAAVLVEQRAITYSMDAASRCFSISDRAQAEGLLEGVRGLLATSSG